MKQVETLSEILQIRKIFYILFLPLNLMFKLYLYALVKYNPKRKITKDDTLFNAVMKMLYAPINFFMFTKN